MKKIIASFFCILFISCILPVYATVSVTAQAEADEKIHVVFHFSNITDYQLINQSLIDNTTIPEAIISQNSQLEINYSASELSFNDSASSIHAVFNLYGADVLNCTLNMNTMTRMYSLKTDWRKFHLNLTAVSYNFTEIFSKSIGEWQNCTDSEDRTCFIYSGNSDVSFSFKLPTSAKNIRIADDEMIIFEIPLSKGDNLLNSPFLILIVVIVANIFAFVYRKAKKVTG